MMRFPITFYFLSILAVPVIASCTFTSPARHAPVLVDNDHYPDPWLAETFVSNNSCDQTLLVTNTYNEPNYPFIKSFNNKCRIKT